MRARLIEAGLIAVVGAGVVLASQLVWSPPPISAATTVGGGVALFLVAGRRPWLTTTIGVVLGWALGVALHARSHVVEDRVPDLAEFLQHLTRDGATGLAIGVVAIVAGGALAKRLRRRDEERK